MGAGGIATRPLKLCIVDKGLEMYSCTWRRNMTPCLFFSFLYSLPRVPCMHGPFLVPIRADGGQPPQLVVRTGYAPYAMQPMKSYIIFFYIITSHAYLKADQSGMIPNKDPLQLPRPGREPRFSTGEGRLRSHSLAQHGEARRHDHTRPRIRRCGRPGRRLCRQGRDDPPAHGRDAPRWPRPRPTPRRGRRPPSRARLLSHPWFSAPHRWRMFPRRERDRRGGERGVPH